MPRVNCEALSQEQRVTLVKEIDALRILDPACGSGAFLVHALETVSRIRVQLDPSVPLHRVRRRMLTCSIFGVDINPMAVWLCELRLWLSMAIEDPETNPLRVTPLPNLDRNVRVGDSLSGDDFRGGVPTRGSGFISRVRASYSRATGPRKKALAKQLDSAERFSALAAGARQLNARIDQRRETLALIRSRDLFGARIHPDGRTKARLLELKRSIADARQQLRRIRSGGALPFSFQSAFSDVAEAGGFDIVVGNPPWIRTHNLDRESRVRLRSTFQVYEHAAWRSGSESAAAGRGFASQVDASALFIERSVRLLSDSGVAGLIVPSKLWRSLAGGGVREFLLGTTQLRQLHDFSSSSTLFEAAAYPSVLVASRSRSTRASLDWCRRAPPAHIAANDPSHFIEKPPEVRGCSCPRCSRPLTHRRSVALARSVSAGRAGTKTLW